MRSRAAAGTPITEERLSSERNRILFAALPASSAASLVLAALLVFVQWDQVGITRSAVWFTTFVIVMTARLIVRASFRRHPGVSDARAHERRYILGAAASGAVWGLATLLLYASNPAHLLFIAFVIAGVSAGAVSSIGASALASALFLSLSLLPLSARLFLTGGLMPVTMGIMTLLFLVFLVLSTRRISSTLHDNIVLRFEEEGRKEAERTQSEILQRMGSIARIGTWDLDLPTNTVRASDYLYAMLGAPQGEPLTIERMLHAFADPGRREIEAGIRQSIANGDRFETERRMTGAGGAELWTRVLVAPVVHDGTVTRVQGILEDITERRRVEVLKSEFVSTVSHELRTPLTSIRGAVGLIASGATGELPSRAQDMLEIALRNCDRLIILINDLLDIEKIESGATDFTLVRQSIMPLVTQATESMTAFAKNELSRIEVSGDASAVADVDGPRLIQVLINLLSNAIKFSPQDTAVRVDVSQDSSCILIAVIDEGPGISPEFMPRLFDRFSQLDSSDKRRQGGTGLGLAISRSIIESMGGRIEVDSTPGSGSTFTIRLPHSPSRQADQP
jgi:PAS domain S-box-containing protein